MNYDIAIIGGGMVGASLACALGGSRLRVAVVEPVAAPRRFPPGDFDIRVSAITRATQNVFAAVGAWEGMVARRVQPYEAMHVWDACGSGSIHFDCTELGEPDLGHIVENRVILAALLDRLGEFDNIDFLCPAHATGLQLGDEMAQLFLADGRTLTAQLLVGTDGTTSWVREQAGIDSTGWAYDQSALVATVQTSRHHQNAAWQRFLPTGPLAFLPLPEGYSSIVWSTGHAQAEVLRTLPAGEFLDQLQQAFGDSLGRMASVGPRGVFPLRLQHADRYVLPRLALAGNAAHALHPLAGQGLNIGVLDVAALAEVLLQAGQRDIGSLSLLRRYERWRKGDNIAMVGAMDVFKRLFSNDKIPLVQLRNLGLGLADRLHPVKNFFMRHGLGLAGDLPPLARGPRH
ncbi:MAG: FAD-dependent 2-octaprenylphenol hydroxylase [Thiohalomonadaceae bacterium]